VSRVLRLERPLDAWPRLRFEHSVFERPQLFLGAMLLLVLALPVWLSTAHVDQVVRVEGRVIPAGRSQEIQHLEGGIVASINTAEGASVRRGDLLLTIDDTTVAATLSEAQIKLNSQRVRAVRLEAEANNQNTLDFPADLANLPVTAAEQSLFQARRAKLNQEIAVHESTIVQHTGEIEEARQRRVRLLAESETATQRLEMQQKMAAQGAASKMDVLEAQSREQRLRTEIGEAESAIPKLEGAIAEERARIATAKAEFGAQAHNDLVAALEEIDGLRQRITGDADRMKRTEIRAPVDGVVNRIAVNTVGGVIKPGENLIELIPTTSGLLIEARARPRDRGYLQIGLDSQIRVSAFDAGEFGLLKGKVTGVGSDSIQDGKNDNYYQVNILVQNVPASYAGHVLVPGMTVTADVVTGRRTILAYLLSPVRKFTYAMFRDPR
jgi:adhesin transport system membrane fusion protein